MARELAFQVGEYVMSESNMKALAEMAVARIGHHLLREPTAADIKAEVARWRTIDKACADQAKADQATPNPNARVYQAQAAQVAAVVGDECDCAACSPAAPDASYVNLADDPAWVHITREEYDRMAREIAIARDPLRVTVFRQEYEAQQEALREVSRVLQPLLGESLVGAARRAVRNGENRHMMAVEVGELRQQLGEVSSVLQPQVNESLFEAAQRVKFDANATVALRMERDALRKKLERIANLVEYANTVAQHHGAAG